MELEAFRREKASPSRPENVTGERMLKRIELSIQKQILVVSYAYLVLRGISSGVSRLPKKASKSPVVAKPDARDQKSPEGPSATSSLEVH